MHKEPIDRYSETPLSKWVEKVPNELETDAIGLWQIIPVLRHSFGLVDKALIAHTRQCLLSLFEKGAQPVVAAQAGQYGWRLNDSYGRTPEEKAEFIIQEWLEAKEDPVFWKSLWLVLPQYITAPPVFSLNEVFYPHEELKLYPGEVYTLPHQAGMFGTRVDNKQQEIIDLSHMPGYPPYLKIRAER